MLVMSKKDFQKDNGYVAKVVSAFLAEWEGKELPVGRYELADGCYAVVSEFDTRVNAKFEAHKRFIDVQYLQSGEEDILCAPLSAGVETVPYNDVKDVTFYSCDNQIVNAHISGGVGVILMPEDLHAPCNGTPVTHNKKILFKIPVVNI